MARVIVRSRSGNVVLAVLGALYAFSALAVLTLLAFEVWNAAAITDSALLLGLIVAAGCGVWFLETSLENLGVRVPHFMQRSHRSA